jgi:hypothetical protein
VRIEVHRLLRSSAAASAVLSVFSQCDRSGEDLHGIFTLGGSGGAALRAQLVCCAPTAPCTRCWEFPVFPSTTRCATCSSASGKEMPAIFLWFVELAVETLPECSSGYSLDLDSTVFERYGHQQGALRGPNPRKQGRPSHHPLVAVLAEAHFLSHGWLHSGNSRGVVGFLKEALALLPEKHALHVVRADAGFFDQQLLGFLEQRELSYIVVARLTLWLKREAARVQQWRALDQHYAVGEFSLQLFGWDRPRRFVVLREQLRAERPHSEESFWRFPAKPSASLSPTSPCRQKRFGAITIAGQIWKTASRVRRQNRRGVGGASPLQ